VSGIPELKIVKQEGSPLIDFAVSEIKCALSKIGFTVSIFSFSEIDETGGLSILIGSLSEAPWLKEFLVKHEIEPPDLKPEGFAIRTKKTDDYTKLIIVIGSDQKGAMYGGLDIAEVISLEGNIDAVMHKEENPFLEMRGVKFNMLLKGYGLRGEGGKYWDEESSAWFFNLLYWNKYLDFLARSRYNTLTLWCGHPYHYMVKLEKYPEATAFSEKELDSNIQFFRTIMAMAKDRGIDTYVVTWNIHVSPELAKANNIPQDGYDSLLVKDYMKECVKALLKTYPDLKGVGTCAGERMTKDLRYNAQWVKDTYIAAIRESDRNVSLLFRAWYADPEITQEVIASDYPAPVYISQKYNGEHMYSSTTPHDYKEKWITQKPRSYKLFWHLRNDDLYIFRWGDPQFVRETIKNCKADYSVGYFQGSEDIVLGLDLQHSEIKEHLFEKHWFREMLWGRLGYNPAIPEEFWVKMFKKRFGSEVGEDVYRALVSASKIIPTTTCFHWNYMDGDWYPEFCLGGWNTGGNYREYKGEGSKFHSILEWIFNHTLEEKWLTIPDYVNRVVSVGEVSEGEIAPIDVADKLYKYSEETLGLVCNVKKKAASINVELECTLLDLEALAYLGHYYAEKTRGATELMFFLRTGDKAHQAKSIEHLSKALEWWDKLMDVTSSHYATSHLLHASWMGAHTKPEDFHWYRHRKDVLRDIEVAKQLGIAPHRIH